jgi:hypothetical protein
MEASFSDPSPILQADNGSHLVTIQKIAGGFFLGQVIVLVNAARTRGQKVVPSQLAIAFGDIA